MVLWSDRALSFVQRIVLAYFLRCGFTARDVIGETHDSFSFSGYFQEIYCNVVLTIGWSFENISQRNRIGDLALTRVRSFRLDISTAGNSFWYLFYFCGGRRILCLL